MPENKICFQCYRIAVEIENKKKIWLYWDFKSLDMEQSKEQNGLQRTEWLPWVKLRLKLLQVATGSQMKTENIYTHSPKNTSSLKREQCLEMAAVCHSQRTINSCLILSHEFWSTVKTCSFSTFSKHTNYDSGSLMTGIRDNTVTPQWWGITVLKKDSDHTLKTVILLVK